MKSNYDVAIVGGGFYGAFLSIFLRSKGLQVALFEKEKDILLHASAINQARVHTGFHYPRSITTAVRSLLNMPMFVLDFKKAIVDDFSMLYAIAKNNSKVNALRFYKMFKDMKAPISVASESRRILFDEKYIEKVFEVKEFAFDCNILRDIINNKIETSGVDCFKCKTIVKLERIGGQIVLSDDTGCAYHAKSVFNCTYSMLNNLLENSGLPLLALKHELTEMALILPPDSLAGVGVTVMDGPFFSAMPFPSRQCWTLSHVRYTPHHSWKDSSPCCDSYAYFRDCKKQTNYPFMVRDASKYMPKLSESKYIDSLWEIKTVLIKSEINDSRPILVSESSALPRCFSVLGSKLDNVYDLFVAFSDIKKLL